MPKQYLTKERLAEFQDELDTLKNKRRVEVAERLKQAKEYGDLSENSEYAEAREEQANVETRIAELEDLLSDPEIIEKKGGGDSVSVGSTVTAKRGDRTMTYTVVGSYEAKPEEGRISDESPIGRAFIKKKVHDKVEVSTPAGIAVYEILKIE